MATTTRVTLRIPIQDKRNLREIANRQGETMSVVIRKLIREYIFAFGTPIMSGGMSTTGIPDTFDEG